MATSHFDWRVRGPFGDVEIKLHPSSVDDATRESSQRELSGLVYDLKARHPEARRILLEVYARLRGLPVNSVRGEAYDFDTGSPRAAAIGAELLREARAGNLVVRRRAVRSVVVALAVETEPVLGPEPVPTGSIAIELLDDQGNAVPNALYRIECDDGRLRTGATNGWGRAREEGLHEGTCKVSFPRLHGPDWKKAG